MGSLPRQGVPQEWTPPSTLTGPGWRSADDRGGRPQRTTVVFSVLIAPPSLANRCGNTSMLRRASSARSPPLTTSSAERDRTTFPRQGACPTVSHHVSRPSGTDTGAHRGARPDPGGRPWSGHTIAFPSRMPACPPLSLSASPRPSLLRLRSLVHRGSCGPWSQTARLSQSTTAPLPFVRPPCRPAGRAAGGLRPGRKPSATAQTACSSIASPSIAPA